MDDLQKLLDRNFPIPSQTSPSDKLFLLRAIAVIKERVAKFRYIEIGSFMGGSLTPFLLDSACDLVVSVDERERQQPDERGARFDYAGITSQAMIDNLIRNGLDVSKLVSHDGSVSSYNENTPKFDIAFIDGEHTDIACVRDFIWTYPLMNDSSMMLFHDSTVVYKGLAIIRELALEKNVDFQILKDQKSEISALFLGAFSRIEHRNYFGEFEDWSNFQEKSESSMLSAVFANRVDCEIKYRIKPMPLRKAY